jgi:chromate transport protein ChrA
MDDRTQRIDRRTWQREPGDVDLFDEGEPEAPARRFTPVRVALAIALVGSILFLAFALTLRDSSQVPLLASGFAILGIVLVAIAFLAVRSTWRAATDGRNRSAFGLAVGGGVAAMFGFGCLALAIVLALVWER